MKNLTLKIKNYQEDVTYVTLPVSNDLTEEQINRNVRQSPFWYVNSFLDSLRAKFQEIMYNLVGQNVDVDEQCIPWKGRHISRCYNPNKPEKRHFK
jgi:hypothetical protein